MAVLDLLGRRLTLRVLWELRSGEPLTFRELQDRCDGASSSTLNARLQELDQAGIVEHVGGYRLSASGQSLAPVLMELQRWAGAWAADLGMGDDTA